MNFKEITKFEVITKPYLDEESISNLVDWAQVILTWEEKDGKS